MRYGAAPRLRRDLVTLAIVSAAYLAVSSFVTNSYYQLIMTLVPIWATFGVSWNILSGYGGQLSFGHASFFGIGAYVVTLALVYWNITPWLGIPLGMIVAACAAVLIGLPTFRLRGHYFALSMLAYPLAILYFLQYLGFQEMSLPMHRENPAAFLEFTNPHNYTLVAVALLIAAIVVCTLVENSRFGLALLAIRQNELAAEAAGINALLWKMRALVVSGMIAAAAGGFYACVLLVVTPDSVFGLLVSAQAVVVTLFGGVAAIWGPVIGAAILVPLAESLNAELGNILPGIQGVVYGVAIIAIMLAAPDGLFWTIRDRFFTPKAASPLPASLAASAPPVTRPAAPGTKLLSVTNSVQIVRRPARGQRGQFRGRRGRDRRHHRPQRSRQNHIVQCPQRGPAGNRRHRDARRRNHARQESPPGLPLGRRPHLPGGPQLPSPAAAGQCHRRSLRRRLRGCRRDRLGRAGTGACRVWLIRPGLPLSD